MWVAHTARIYTSVNFETASESEDSENRVSWVRISASILFFLDVTSPRKADRPWFCPGTPIISLPEMQLMPGAP